MQKPTERAANVRPTGRQLAWHKTEFYAFVHFGPNTFTNREWGTGQEDPRAFHPTAMDARQWVRSCVSAGMKGLILTCKHHDGYCLWPSALTEHSVKNSGWRDGRGDVVREVSDACRDGGIKFGVYLSPWDRHDIRYGDSPAYNRYVIGQLEELLSGYGPIFSVWFDGACGEGPNGKRQVYDWDAYYRTIRRLQPDACISVCGPDVRWCGNEAGHCRASEWSVVPAALLDVEKIEEKSQKIDDGEFSRRISSSDDDLGSRAAIREAEELVWYPAEVNTSIRPGWFYHAEEDNRVRSLHELLEIYFSSVGGNANFLLNIPPDTRGLFHENDAERLREIGDALRTLFERDLTEGAEAISATTARGPYLAGNVLDGNQDTYWRPPDGTETADLVVNFAAPRSFSVVVLEEHIASSGQRIEAFTVEYLEDEVWKTCFRGTVVGYRRICRFDRVSSPSLRLRITGSRWYPTISRLSVYGPSAPE